MNWLKALGLEPRDSPCEGVFSVSLRLPTLAMVGIEFHHAFNRENCKGHD